MCLHFHIFLLDCYCRPYKKDRRVFEVSLLLMLIISIIKQDWYLAGIICIFIYVFNKFNACFYLTIVFMVLGWCYGCWIFNLLQNTLNVSGVIFIPTSKISFLGNQNSTKIIMVALPAHLQGFLLKTYCLNLQYKKVFIINHEYVRTNYIQGLLWYVKV